MLKLSHISHSYHGPEGRIGILEDINLRASPGELVMVTGPSGCGKSTLLFIAGAMLAPERGGVQFGDRNPYHLSNSQRNRFRALLVGFVFQRFHLIPYLTVEDNLRCPLLWSDDPLGHVREIPEIAKRLGIRQRLGHLPCQLSAGEQQRVAVARSLLGKKQLICADEPTGNLDAENAGLIADALREATERGCVVLLATHHSEWPVRSDTRLHLGT